MDVLLLVNFFRYYMSLKLGFRHNSARRKLFLSAFYIWNYKVSLREMSQKFPFGGLIGYGTFFWTLYYVTRKYSDYMQYYMMLLEQFDQILTEDLTTVIGLDKVQNFGCLVT